MKQISQYINGNHTVTLYDNGTKVKETFNEDDEYFTYTFPENFDIKINDRCDGGCRYCHEGSTKDGKLVDLSKFVDSPLYKSIHSGTEMAIGGGNIFESPDIEVLLNANKKKGIISNITVNQKHLYANLSTLQRWVKDKLVYGIGISVTNQYDDKLKDTVKSLGDNAVLHIINGIYNMEKFGKYDLLTDMKVLVLGYKEFRLGKSYRNLTVEVNKAFMEKYLKNLRNRTKVLSFDCLAIEQLDVKNNLEISDEDWDELFQGDDHYVDDGKGNITCATMYIDLPRKMVGRTSTSLIKNRYKFTYDETIEDLFKKSTGSCFV